MTKSELENLVKSLMDTNAVISGEAAASADVKTVARERYMVLQAVLGAIKALDEPPAPSDAPEGS